MLLPPTCFSFGLPVSPACLSVSQTSMDDSGHKRNTGELLNSTLEFTLFMTQVSVCQSQSKLHSVHPPPLSAGGGGVGPPTKF